MSGDHGGAATFLTTIHASGYARTPGRTTSSGVVVPDTASLVFLSGQVASDPSGAFVGYGDLDAQLRQIYRNIEALAREARTDMSAVIALRTYLVAGADLEVYRNTKGELSRGYWGGTGRFPANTMLVVSRLAESEYLAEIEAVLAVRTAI